jgi:hypothetical protein
MNMELDEMKQAWLELDQRLAQQEALNWQIFREGQADKLRRGLRPLVWGQSVQIALGIAITLWGVSFWSTHSHVWQAMTCGIVMQVFGMLAILFPVRVLSLVQAIDYAAPVLDIQRRLARLRTWRVKVEAPVFSVLGSFIWIPAMLMLIQDEMDRTGVNLWKVMSGKLPWLLSSAAISLAVVGLAYVLLRWLGHRRWLEDNFAGSAVKRAESMLEAIAKFERE